MLDPITLTLTPYQRNCLKAAVSVAVDRLEDPEAAREIGRSVMDAVCKAQDILGVEYGFRCNDERTEAIDELWDKFWDQTHIDFAAWFRGAEGSCDPGTLEPKGWPAFRDKGLQLMLR